MNLDCDDYVLCLQGLRKFRPRIVFGITTALTGFAKFVQQEGVDLSPCQPEVVITWAGPMYEHERHLLEEVFGCPASNIYGSREVGHVACTCPEGSLHVNQENYLVEVEQDSDASCRRIGQLLITPLFPTPMPLLRYRIGDLGEIADGACPCGRSHLVLKSILGRSSEVFTTRRGRMIAPNFWCRSFMGHQTSRSVEQFQVVIEDDNQIDIRVVRRDSYNDDTERYLLRYLSDQFQDETRFRFIYVPRIEPQPSGKFQMVIDKRGSPSMG